MEKIPIALHKTGKLKKLLPMLRKMENKSTISIFEVVQFFQAVFIWMDEIKHGLIFLPKKHTIPVILVATSTIG